MLGARSLTKHLAMWQGATSRQGEEVVIREALTQLGLDISEVECPGTIDGGDVLYASGMLFVGKSRYDFTSNLPLHICDINPVLVVTNLTRHSINMCLFSVQE